MKSQVDTTDRSQIANLLARGRNRRDTDRTVIDDLGYSLGLWNGESGDGEAAIDIHCGIYNSRFVNSVVIMLPEYSPGSGWGATPSDLLGRVAEIWRPRWAGIMSNGAMRKRGFEGPGPFVEWLVYVPKPVRNIEPPSRAEAVGDIGTIVIVQPEPPLGNDPEAADRIRYVENALAQ